MKPDDLTHPRVTAARSDRHYPVEGMGRQGESWLSSMAFVTFVAGIITLLVLL